jgi:hypothetical protein
LLISTPRATLTAMRTLLTAAFSLVIAQATAAGLALDQPKLIDAAAIVLMPGILPSQIDRKSDATVRVNIIGSVFELRQVQSRPCIFQTVVIGQPDRVSQQFDFTKTYGDYEIGPSNIARARVRLHGESMWCQKDASGTICRNSHDVNSWNGTETQRIVKALSFIFNNGCSPLGRPGLR